MILKKYSSSSEIDHIRRNMIKVPMTLAGILFGNSVQASSSYGSKNGSFELGVASGDPNENGFVIWSKISFQQAHFIGAVPVQWEVWSLDESKLISKGDVTASSELGHSVHVEVSGLASNSWFKYRFILGNTVSPWGHARTMASFGSMDVSLRVAYASCQRWEHGHYAAYRHMLSDRPDLVMFVGDYIYEYASKRSVESVRTHNTKHARTLDDYRSRYSLYRSDPFLQQMHAACPWVVTWDDHEVENDYAGELSTVGTLYLTIQRMAAYQAFYEFMPIRRSALLNGLVGLAQGAPIRLHRSLNFGNLAAIHVLDNRQYRETPLCASKTVMTQNEVCSRQTTGVRSMLGFEQEKWLAQSLNQSARDGYKWNLIAQQTRFTPSNYKTGLGIQASSETWDGFSDARQRLIDDLISSKAQNPVFLGGDVHQNWVADVYSNPYNINSKKIAAEFCGTSITSNGVSQKTTLRIKENNPHCLLANSEYRGYGLVDIQPSNLIVSLRVLNDVTSPNATVSTLAKFKVNSGVAGIEKI